MGLWTLPPEDWRSVARRVRTASAPITWSWVAARNMTGGWDPGVLSVRSGVDYEPLCLLYRDVVIVREQLTPRVAANRLREGRVGRLPRVKRPLRFDPPQQVLPNWMTTEQDYAYNLVTTEWPQYHLNTSISPMGALNVRMLDPLHEPGLPFYASLVAALAETVYCVSPNSVQTVLNPHLLIRLPDTRARIGWVSFAEDVISVAIAEGAQGAARGFLLRATWRSERESRRWERRDFPIGAEGVVAIETGPVPVEMSILLSDNAGKMTDRYGWSLTGGIAPNVPQSLAGRVARWLTEGEHNELEYKAKLGEPQVNKSFGETVAAFSNGPRGGVILVGVDDDGTVVGYGNAKAADQITTIVRETITEAVTVRIERAEVDETPIQVVTVLPGDTQAKPYRYQGHVMIRAGATTREAMTWEIRRLANEGGLSETDPLLQGYGA